MLTLLNQIKTEIKKNFPYRVIEIYGAEADDIIATLVKFETKWDTDKNLIVLDLATGGVTIRLNVY